MSAAETPDEAADSAHSAKVGGFPATMWTRLLDKARIIDPVLAGKEAPSFRTLAAQRGLTEKDAANRVLTARRAYHRSLRGEIRLYAVSDEEVAAKIQDLWRFMAE